MFNPPLDRQENEQFRQYLNQLRAAAASARQGNSRESEVALRNVAAVPPIAVVQLSLAAMNDVFSSFPPPPNSEAEHVGPFLLLVAARLLHGGLARDWSSFWNCRLDALREVRSNLENHLKMPAVHSPWLAPAVSEVSVAWAVLTKMILIANNSNNNNNDQHQQNAENLASSSIPPEALSFLIDEWCGMVSSVNDDIRTASVYTSLVRQSVEEIGLIAKISLGRGLSLEQHESLREGVFERVLPPLMFVVCESMIVLADRIKKCDAASSFSSCNSNSLNTRHHQSQQQQQQQQSQLQSKQVMINVLAKLIDILQCTLCWGPSVWSSEFGVDRVPSALVLPANKFRRVLFSQTDRVKGFSTNKHLLLCEATVASFEVGMHLGRETELSLPALNCLLQLCSISMSVANSPSTPNKVYSPTYSSTENSRELQESGDLISNPVSWMPGEAARWIDELSRVLLSVAGYQIFTNYLPNPSSAVNENDISNINNNNNNNNNSNSRCADALFKMEQTIETGGTLLRVIAQACGRLVTNALKKEVLVLEATIDKFPNDVLVPLHKFAENLIRYHHELSVTIRCIFYSGGDAIGESLQVEEVFTEAIDAMLRAWRDFVRISIDDVECDAELQGTPLRQCIVACAQSVFETFVNSRIRFAQDALSAAASADAMRNKTTNNSVAATTTTNSTPLSSSFLSSSSSATSSSSTATRSGGLVASAIQSHGMEYTLSQISTVGLLGRQDPVVTCSLISSFLGPQVGDYLNALANSPQGPAFAQTESIWYLFQIMAWLLTDDENSSADVPQQINNVALKIENEAARAEAHQSDNIEFWREVERRVPIFNLINGSFVFCKSLIQIVSSAPPGDRKQIILSHISPLVISALLSLFRRYANTYIFDVVDDDNGGNNNNSNSNTDNGQVISRVFKFAFDSGVVAASNIVEFLNWSICHFSAVDEAMKEAGDLLYALASKPHIGEWLMNDRSRCGVVCAAAAGDDSGPLLTARLSGARRGALAGAVISACASDKMYQAAMGFLKYYTQGFASPIAPQNFSEVAGTVASVSNLLANARCAHHLGALVDTAHPYLVEVVNCVTSTHPAQQNYLLLTSLLEVFLNGIEICSFSLSTEVITWMLRSSVSVIDMVGNVVRHSVENVLPSLAGNQQARDREEQNQLRLLKASTALILCAAQWGNMNITEVINGGRSDEREEVVGRLCVDGMLLVLREARNTDLIEVPELSSKVFRLVTEIAQTHTRYFLSVNQESATVLLDATHWALGSADPALIQHGFAIIEALTVAPNSAQKMPRLLSRFLSSCMQALVNGTAVEPSIQTPLSNAVFALGIALGVDALCDAFAEAVSKHPLLSADGIGKDNRYVRIFAEAMFREVQWGMDRKRRRLFAPVLRRIMMVIRNANIFT